MRNFLYVLSALLPICSLAQPGHYFLSHFAPADKKVDHVAFDMLQDTNGFLFFATRAGILQFDGKNWELIEGGGAVYALESDGTGNIYWGGAQGYGSLQRASDGRMVIEVLSGKDVGDIFEVVAGEREVYFLNDEAFFIYEPGEMARTIRAGGPSGAYTSMVEIFGIPYVSTDRSRIFKLQNENELASAFAGGKINDILFASRYQDKYLIGTSDNRLYTCSKDLIMREIVLKEKDYFSARVVVDGAWVTDRLVAIATLRGGVVLLDPASGSVKELIDYNTGLPDNEIYSLLVDYNRNVWVSHDYGLTRIAPFLPLRSYSNYHGLQGNVLCAESFNDDVYVGTSLGLLKLVKEEVYEEITYYTDTDIPVQMQVMTGKAKKGKDRSGRRGLFGFLKRKTDGTDPTGEAQAIAENERHVRKVLRSERYIYKPVDGINAKVTGLTHADGKLLAFGLAGIFEINDLQADPVLEQPVRLAYAAKDGHLIIATYNGQVHLMTREKAGWIRNDMLDGPVDHLSQIFEGLDKELWLCGTDLVHRTTIENGKFSQLQAIRVHNPNFSRLAGFAWYDQIILANANGFYRFDGQSGTMERIDSLGRPVAYYAAPGRLFFWDAHAWRVLGKGEISAGINALSLLKDVRGISAIDDHENMWIIDGNDELYRFGRETLRPVGTYPLMLRSVVQGGRHIDTKGSLAVDQEGGPVTFNIIQPNYSGPSEYRYVLKGISDEWSDWSALNSQITFPYLPSGTYGLQVQSRDIFGNVHELKVIPLLVRPLFWKSSWFYGMELAIFGLLGWLSLKLSVRYRLLSRLLAVLTIIMLIEFIQTLAGYSFSTSSPVADFLLQVGVALLILPVEGYLRKVMFKSGHKSRLLAVIEELNAREKV